MIRILHAADLHLDSPFQSLTARQALERRSEQRDLPGRIAALAKSQKADILLFSGDLFDSDALFSETGHCIEQALAALDIPVFLAPGNHDWYSSHSLWSSLSLGENVHIFTGEEMECVSLPQLGARVWGSAFCSRSRREPLANFEAAKEDNIVDIMCIHGDVGNPESPYAPILPAQIARSGMDYIALGHVHSFSGLQRSGDTFYAWPGCPEGRGFDECGEKGIILAELDPGSCKLDFIPLGGRRYEVVKVDITNSEDTLGTIEAALDGTENGSIYRIILSGESDTPPDLPALHRALADRFYALQLRDETRPRRSLWDGSDENSLRGLFLTKMLAHYNSAADDEAQQRVIRAVRWGLQALDNGEEFPI